MLLRRFLIFEGFGIVLDLAAAEQALKVGGFTQVMCDGKITQLSGGWKMKLALIRATLEEADIMLMVSKINKKRKSVHRVYGRAIYNFYSSSLPSYLLYCHHCSFRFFYSSLLQTCCIVIVMCLPLYLKQPKQIFF